MPENVWETETGVTIRLPNGNVVERETITASDLKEIARENGLKKFIVETENGQVLGPGAFPVSEGTIILKEYNEAK